MLALKSHNLLHLFACLKLCLFCVLMQIMAYKKHAYLQQIYEFSSHFDRSNGIQLTCDCNCSTVSERLVAEIQINGWWGGGG